MSDTVSRQPARSRQFWEHHVQQWQESGLSKIAYCQQHNLNSGNFYNWSRPGDSKKQQKNKPNQKPGTALQLIPVSVDPAPSFSGTVLVERAATRISLPFNLSDQQINNWLQAIHQLHV